MSSKQQTLTGDSTDADRVRPETMLWCDECDEPVLRSRRFDHEHDFTELMAYEKAQLQQLDEKIPDHAKVETQQYIVDFHYTCVERVKVEASHKAEAKRIGEEIRTYDGEVLDTVHTEKRTVGDPGPPTIEYLESHNLLPEDHDVTQDDLDQLMESDV